MDLKDLSRIRESKTRSISAENFSGAPGMGGRCAWEDGIARKAAEGLGTGWKVNPYIRIAPGETFTLASIEGPGVINHIWMTPTGQWRDLILRIYWDEAAQPAVEAPVGDFFCCGWNEYCQVSSLPVCVNPGSALNCYWSMPFRKAARITMENRSGEARVVYYQIDYALEEVPEDAAYFHAQFRRVNPLPFKTDYVVLDGVQGRGQYVGTYLAWGVNNNGWWGEGEFKFFIDEDTEYPTICGTGTEDYFCGSYDFEDPVNHDRYLPFTTPYTGMTQVTATDRLYKSQMRFSMYRFHLTDPVRFTQRLKVTVQALGWRHDGRYLPLQDDIASVAFWYQELPTAAFPPLPDADYCEII